MCTYFGNFGNFIRLRETILIILVKELQQISSSARLVEYLFTVWRSVFKRIKSRALFTATADLFLN